MKNDGKWVMNVAANDKDGWTTTICVGCTNGDQTIFQDNFTAS